MTEFEFLTYCVGVSTVIVSLGVAIRLGRHPPIPARVDQADTQRPEPVADLLAARLQALQEARYASPIVQRVLDPRAVPLRRPVRPTPVPVRGPAPKKED